MHNIAVGVIRPQELTRVSNKNKTRGCYERLWWKSSLAIVFQEVIQVDYDETNRLSRENKKKNENGNASLAFTRCLPSCFGSACTREAHEQPQRHLTGTRQCRSHPGGDYTERNKGRGGEESARGHLSAEL